MKRAGTVAIFALALALVGSSTAEARPFFLPARSAVAAAPAKERVGVGSRIRAFKDRFVLGTRRVVGGALAKGGRAMNKGFRVVRGPVAAGVGIGVGFTAGVATGAAVTGAGHPIAGLVLAGVAAYGTTGAASKLAYKAGGLPVVATERVFHAGDMIRPDMTGAEVKAARTKAGLTQAALAKKLGVSRSAISHWETGTNRIASFRQARLKGPVLGAYR